MNRDHGRLDADEYPAWSLDETLDFLQTRCGLTGRLPGFVVEDHGELFYRWRDAIDAGVLRAPFHVTHVDAHADLGLGDYGYVHLMSDLLFREPQDRRDPGDALNGQQLPRVRNRLPLAVRARLRLQPRQSRGPQRPRRSDVVPDGGLQRRRRPHPARRADQAADRRRAVVVRGPAADAARLEPRVPFRHMGWPQFTAPAPFDLICLARSPEYTPETCDELFDAIRERFIDEDALAR